MTTLSDLEKAVDAILAKKSYARVLRSGVQTKAKEYEKYVFLLVLLAVKEAGANVAFFGINTGKNPSSLILRSSPGYMYSTRHNYAHAKCKLEDKEFEIHLGVQYIGKSGAKHEVDVSMIDYKSACKSRVNKELPKHSGIHLAIECKLYDSWLGVIQGRAFVGLLADMRHLEYKGFVTNGTSKGLSKYFSPNGRPDFFPRLSPLDCDVINRFMSDVNNAVRKWCGTQ